MVVETGGWAGAANIRWVAAKGAAAPYGAWDSPPARNYQAPNVNSAAPEKPCSMAVRLARLPKPRVMG